MIVREGDLAKTIVDFEIKSNALEDNLYHVHAKVIAMYEHMKKTYCRLFESRMKIGRI